MATDFPSRFRRDRPGLEERSVATGARESQLVREALELYLSAKHSEQTTCDLLRKAG